MIRPLVSILLPRDYTTLPSSDNNIPVSLRVPIALYPLRAEELITWPTNNTFITLPTSSSPQHAYISKTYTINSSKRLWEIKEILQIRIDQGQGSSPKCVKRYLVRWTTSRLSAKELWYARKTWEIVKTSRDVRAGRGALDQKTNVQWAPSWVSSSDFNPRLGASESAKYQSVQ